MGGGPSARPPWGGGLWPMLSQRQLLEHIHRNFPPPNSFPRMPLSPGHSLSWWWRSPISSVVESSGGGGFRWWRVPVVGNSGMNEGDPMKGIPMKEGGRRRGGEFRWWRVPVMGNCGGGEFRWWRIPVVGNSGGGEFRWYHRNSIRASLGSQ